MEQIEDKKGTFIILHSKREAPDIYKSAEKELNAYGYAIQLLEHNKNIKSFCTYLVQSDSPQPYYILAYGESVRRLAKLKKSLPAKLEAIILISPIVAINKLINFRGRTILQKPNFLSGHKTSILIFTTSLASNKYLDTIADMCTSYRMIYSIVIKGAKTHLLEDSSAYQNQFWAGLRAYLNLGKSQETF
ncbi:hypothetical protein [Bartonella sp. TP]|uniref:hypothetical protein n=1 Tax=Bartonella sp. TP TaxID=3057550 RepID=UPI0025B1AD5B|nr:hypothetical protein [Bartonella sp. TP]MDN5248835.1 hypothetical protein [Alphaproteobacteria bacterium]MDN5248929.1 hypothetical protein [Alphaproteobacteria bacterium]WJW80081.1 hypothetical protein QVL57_00490 [Bartonella sp. TP]